MDINIDTIIHDDNPIIRTHSADVELPLSAEDEQLVKDMLQYVKDSQDEELCKEKHLQPAVGISAIQLAIPKKLVAVHIPADEEEDEPEYSWALANPKIISRSVRNAYLKSGEGCLSVPEGHEGFVPRSYKIKVRAYDAITQEPVVIKVKGYPAIVLQHEIDHLTGKLYYDHIDPEDPFTKDHSAVEL